MVTALGFIPAPRDESGNNHERERERLLAKTEFWTKTEPHQFTM